MVVDYLFRVVQAAVTDLDDFSVEDFSEHLIFGKCLSTRARNLCPMSVLVFLLKRRVVPEDVIAFSVFPFACFGWFVL